MAIKYDNPHWEYHLPVNPPGAYLAEGDIVMDRVDVRNWATDDGFEYRPRLRDRVQWVNRLRLATDIDAPEIDEEYDCD